MKYTVLSISKKKKLVASGSRVKPYADLYIDSGGKLKPFNWRLQYVMLGSGKKVWRWNNSTPNWLKWLMELRRDIKNAAYPEIGFNEQGIPYEIPGVPARVVIWHKIKQALCKHDWEVWDEGDAESGPCVYAQCKKCGKGAGPSYYG